ncbi:hypothetical protein [Cryptosporangium arvum]|uniref:hypothetical protein n=1 Tax=Cryptosporangium arvum TaxID=80871 RepID=UPI0004B9F9A3|nr:hypothetical protein [Cryptosporangium arvum]
MLIALVPPIVRAARTGPFLLACAAGWVLLAIPAALTTTIDPNSLTLQLRLATVCAAVGAVFLLDDPAKPTTLVVPTRAWVTTALRIGLGVLLAALWWGVAVAIVLVGAEDGVGDDLRLGGTAVEAATILAVALLLGVAGYRLAERGVGSTAAAPTLLVVVGSLALLPRDAALFVAVSDPAWADVHARWSVLLLTACAGLMVGAGTQR